MAKRGRPPKSPEIKELEGNPGNRPIQSVSVNDDLSSDGLRMPARLTEVERQVWQDTVCSMPSWWFRQADKYMLLLYCRAIARIEKSERALKNSDTILTRANGSKCLNPHLQVIQAGSSEVLKLSEMLGLTRARRGMSSMPPNFLPPAPLNSDLDGEEPEAFGDLLAPAIGEPNE